MCGIYSLLNTNLKQSELKKIFKLFLNGSKRGPDNSKFDVMTVPMAIVGFHRLAINGLNAKSDQPICIDNVVLICNGEIYNHKELAELINVTPETDSDCEIIIHLYKKFGIDKTLQMLDGVFAFNLFDIGKGKMFVSRDPFGVRPLYESYYETNNIRNYIFSSTLHTITSYIKDYVYSGNSYSIKQFTPGTYKVFYFVNELEWQFVKQTTYYKASSITENPYITENIALQYIKTSLENAVRKRVNNCERDIACLLSGGLDSSLITSLVNRYYKEKTGRPVETYSIGMEGSQDLKHAKVVADFLGTKHTTVVVSEDEFFNAIPDVISHIETYDTTTVRASVGNYLVAKYITENSDAKVIFNGDGSDEVCGGYLYFHYAPNNIDFDIECKRLLNDIHFFDVLRSDRTISSNGLEARTPFLDKRFVNTYLSIPSLLRYNTTKEHCEKYLLRKAFDDNITLPKNVLWRTKEAFSDGVSTQTKSWYEIIQERVEDISSLKTKRVYNLHNPPKTTEQRYYRDVFNKMFYNNDTIIPYFWMPRFVNATDASARTLSIYKDKNVVSNVET